MQAWEAAGSVGVRGRGVFLDNQHSELCLLVEVPQGLEQGEGLELGPNPRELCSLAT